MGAKAVCSGCASWVEEGWSYCMHCGAARPVRRSSLTLSTALYSNTRGTTAVASKENRSLRRRRQSSEEVGRQLQQVRTSWESVLFSHAVGVNPTAIITAGVVLLLHVPHVHINARENGVVHMGSFLPQYFVNNLGRLLCATHHLDRSAPCRPYIVS